MLNWRICSGIGILSTWQMVFPRVKQTRMHVGYVRSCMGNMSQRGISVYNAGKSLHVRECRLQAYRPPSGSHALTFSQFVPLIAGKLSLMWASFHLAIKHRLSPHCSRQEAQLSQSNRTCQLKPCHNQMIAFEKARNRWMTLKVTQEYRKRVMVCSDSYRLSIDLRQEVMR